MTHADALLLRACALACRVAARDAGGLRLREASRSLKRAQRMAAQLRAGKAGHNRVARVARVTVEQAERAIQSACSTRLDPVQCAQLSRSAIRAADAALREAAA